MGAVGRAERLSQFHIGEENLEVFDANRDLPEPMRPYQGNRIAAEAKPRTGHWHRGTFVWNRNAGGRKGEKR